MKLIRKSTGIWMLDYIDPLGKRRRISTGTRDKAEAESRAVDLMRGKNRTTGEWTLAECLDYAMKHVWNDARSWRSFEVIVRLTKPEIGHLLLSEVTYEALREWAQMKRKQDLAPATVNRRLSAIRRALVEAVRIGKLHGVPETPRQLENNKKFRWLNEEEEARLLAGCCVLSERDAALMRHCISFLIDTGARLNEMLRLVPTDIRGNTVLFRDTKSRADKYRARTVPLTRRALAAAKEIAKLNEYDIMWTQDQLVQRFNKARREAKLADVNRHTLRHTCASRLVQRGADIYRVKVWLGHSNVQVTERYAHLADTGMDDLANLLEGVPRNSCGAETTWHSAKNVAHLPNKKSI